MATQLPVVPLFVVYMPRVADEMAGRLEENAVVATNSVVASNLLLSPAVGVVVAYGVMNVGELNTCP